MIGTARAAFGYSGQKCSAASRAYVHEAVYEEFTTRLSSTPKRCGSAIPHWPKRSSGPVINQAAYETFQEAAARSRDDGTILLGGDVMTDGDARYGYFVEPTIAALPTSHKYFAEELFLPFLTVGKVGSLDEALTLCNASEFGLTAGIFTEDPAEQQRFLDGMHAGVLYVNRKGGATTGAWPGVQSFGGWKGVAQPASPPWDRIT